MEILPSDSKMWTLGSSVKSETSSIYGRYTVATRHIESGELLGVEHALVAAACSPSDDIRPCLTCCLEIRTDSEQLACSKCKWPICSRDCEIAFQHADNECRILVDNQVSPAGVPDDYLCVEVLRTLLIRDRDPETWNRITRMESHVVERAVSKNSIEATILIEAFIRKQCCQTQFDPSTVNIVLGVITVNSFWLYKDCKRHISALFEMMSLIPNDCDGNTRREAEIRSNCTTEAGKWGVSVREFASRSIEANEIVTARYSQIPNVTERRAFLKSLFHFDCVCKRCIRELNSFEIEP